MAATNVAPMKVTRPPAERLSAQLERIDAVLQIIRLYEQSCPEGAPALALAARELDAVRDAIDLGSVKP